MMIGILGYVKFANYSSYGLPVLTNEWVGEVSRLINKYNLVPSVIYHDKYFELNSPTKIQKKKRIRKWALNYFQERILINLFDHYD